MRRSLKEILGIPLVGTDGLIGHCCDLHVDVERWAIRYLEVDTRAWLPDRRVLISPMSLGEVNWGLGYLPVLRACKDFEDAPVLEQQEPVTRRYERALALHQGIPFYWAGGGLWGTCEVPPRCPSAPERSGPELQVPPGALPEFPLHTTRELFGRSVEARNGGVGHVEDVIMETGNWSVHARVVDAASWMPTDKVLLHPEAVTGLAGRRGSVLLDRTVEEIEESPLHSPRVPLGPDHAVCLFEHPAPPQDRL